MENSKQACCSGATAIPVDLSNAPGPGLVPLGTGDFALPPEALHYTDTAPAVPGIPSPDEIPRVATRLELADVLGGWKARWAINRMDYKVAPGLYQVGSPDPDSPVLVSANYKLSFDMLRKELGGLDAWILVLDTRGVNVWCAAGKGTFGTEELVRRIALTGLAQVVRHRKLIVPQLGAPGVAAHKVKAWSGFRVVYGPVRASDIPAFLKAGMKTTPGMRRVHFSIWDRLVVTPVELVQTFKLSFIIGAVLLIANMAGWLEVGWAEVYPFIGAILAGTVVTPIWLPWIPGPAFAWKGWLTGLLWTGLVVFVQGILSHPGGVFTALAYACLLPAISGYLAMNFTGASTYTSLSGVKKEMKYAVPILALTAAAGIVSGLIALIA